jgi:hypothetical protein
MPFPGVNPAARRRAALALLAAAPATVAAPALPALAAAPGAGPHPAWLGEWRGLVAWFDGPTSPDDLSGTSEWDRLLELERLIGSTPAVTVAGAAAQLALATHYMGDDDAGMTDGAYDAFRRAIATVERLAAREARHV